jgi:hypothetical protein
MENKVEKSLSKLAAEINAEHYAFVGTFRKAVEHGIRAGELLAQAKEQCPHGTWLPWLEENFDGSARTAQEYMRLYRYRDKIRAKTRDSAQLSISGALRELASPKGEPAAFEVVSESKYVDPEHAARTTEFIVERVVRPSSKPPTTPTIQIPVRERMAEPDDGLESSEKQGEVVENGGGLQQSYYVSQVIDLLENDLFDRSDQKLVARLLYLRYLLNELDL